MFVLYIGYPSKQLIRIYLVNAKTNTFDLESHLLIPSVTMWMPYTCNTSLFEHHATKGDSHK